MTCRRPWLSCYDSYDLETGNASILRPFWLDENNASGPGIVGQGMASFDPDNSLIWFACIPNTNHITEGVCHAPYTPSTENAPVTALVWADQPPKLSITSIAWSRALSAVVVVAQAEDTDGGPVVTQVGGGLPLLYEGGGR